MIRSTKFIEWLGLKRLFDELETVEAGGGGNLGGAEMKLKITITASRSGRSWSFELSERATNQLFNLLWSLVELPGEARYFAGPVTEEVPTPTGTKTITIEEVR